MKKITKIIKQIGVPLLFQNSNQKVLSEISKFFFSRITIRINLSVVFKFSLSAYEMEKQGDKKSLFEGLSK